MIYAFMNLKPLFTWVTKMTPTQAVHIGHNFYTDAQLKKFLEETQQKRRELIHASSGGIECQLTTATIDIEDCGELVIAHPGIFGFMTIIDEFEPVVGDCFVSPDNKAIKLLSGAKPKEDEIWSKFEIISISPLVSEDISCSTCQLCGVTLTATNTNPDHADGKTNCRCCCESFDIAADHDKSQGL